MLWQLIGQILALLRFKEYGVVITGNIIHDCRYFSYLGLLIIIDWIMFNRMQKSSKINLEETDKSRFGVSSGSSNGGVGTGLKNYKQYLEKGLRGVSPFTGVRYTVNGASAWPAIHFGLEGPNESFSVTCATGNTAIGNAYRKIKYGHADLMLAGSSDYFDEFIVVRFCFLVSTQGRE